MSVTKITEFEAKQRLYNIYVNKIILIEYDGMATSKNSIFHCNICGNTWETTLSNLCSNKIFGCPKCANNNKGSYRKLSYEDATKRIFEIHGDSINMFNYINTYEKADFVCNICGYKWKTTPSGIFYRGSGCKRCADKRTVERLFYSYNKVKKYVESYDCKLISQEYFGATEKLDILMFCGHIKNISLNGFQALPEKICHECKLLDDPKRMTQEDIISRVESYEFEFIKFCKPYKNNTTQIEYKCSFGHITKKSVNNFSQHPTCKKCTNILFSEKISGPNSLRWNGFSSISSFLERHIREWKKASMISSDYSCVITGKGFDEIHHLYPRNKILKEVFENLNLKPKNFINNYSNEEIFLIINENKRLHWEYPLGVCLTKPVHKLFHKLYGSRDFTPENFYEFQDIMLSGKIQVPN